MQERSSESGDMHDVVGAWKSQNMFVSPCDSMGARKNRLAIALCFHEHMRKADQATIVPRSDSQGAFQNRVDIAVCNLEKMKEVNYVVRGVDQVGY